MNLVHIYLLTYDIAYFTVNLAEVKTQTMRQVGKQTQIGGHRLAAGVAVYLAIAGDP